MTDTLTQLIAKLQALLLGDSTTFSTATCTAAIRQALNDLNLRAPGHAAELIEAVSEQYEYELSDSSAMEIVDVLRQGVDAYNDLSHSLPFDGYFEDDRPFFRLRIPEATGRVLIVRYTKPYTICGLDSETVSSLPALHDVILLDGAAWKACLIRAAGRVETINMNMDVTKNFAAMASHFQVAFESGLAHLGRRRFPSSMPVTHGWQDEWSGRY